MKGNYIIIMSSCIVNLSTTIIIIVRVNNLIISNQHDIICVRMTIIFLLWCTSIVKSYRCFGAIIVCLLTVLNTVSDTLVYCDEFCTLLEVRNSAHLASCPAVRTFAC